LKRAVFLDRDGVLNQAVLRDGAPHPPPSVADLHPVEGAREAIAALHDAGFLAVVITNQPDVARGAARRSDVDAINATLARSLALDAVYVCFHDDADGCDCRKPKPGLVRRAAVERAIDLKASYFVGDRAKDVQCGRAAGCTTLLIDFGYRETPADLCPDVKVASLAQAVRCILEREAAGSG
jgi:D-glycero-D-manno-heptose 1,7-bisphosphate phosphatase